MFESEPKYPAFYVPADADRDRAVELGVAWLVSGKFPGEPLVLFHAKKMVTNNRRLHGLITAARLRVSAPAMVWRDGWRGGPVLAPWASAKVLTALDGELADEVSAACVLGWTPGAHETWISAHRAVDLTSGAAAAPATLSDPVVLVAMERAGAAINHNNALVQSDDRAYMVRTLQELVRSGHRYAVDEIAAWALAAGWPGGEVDELRDIAAKVLRGHTFRLAAGYGPAAGAAARWEQQARERGLL